MRIELHAHTMETSRCAHVPAKEVVDKCKAAGYDGIVITDHYSPARIDSCGCTEIKDIIDVYLKGYRAAKEEGEKIGLKVFLGMELFCAPTSSNDYLVYGIDEDFLYNAPVLCHMTFTDCLKVLPEKALVYQAHPFRNGMTITRPELLFGIEVFNGHPRHESRNEIAEMWADMHHLHKISGSDFHQAIDPFHAGADFFDEIRNEDELADALRNDRYTLIKGKL